jgi:DNA repair exonuclease SbcCD ATPase subunit
MSRKLRIKVKKGWIAYPGSTVQQNYAEALTHGYLLWNIDSPQQFDVDFRELPNPRPFITIDWTGSVPGTLEVAQNYPQRSRFRVKHKDHLAHKDTVALTSILKQTMNASEVTFKGDQQAQHDYFNAGSTIVMKDDIRNPQILLKLLKDYYKDVKVSEEEWTATLDLIKSYLATITDDGPARNTSWSIKHLKFDNLFCYGEGNSINFQSLNGIIGIFGPNRSGKSSLPGTLMYSLFNSTDRGSIKNLHVCNARKPYCYSRVVLGIDGIDYAIERQTVKNENKRGEVHAATNLNFYRVDDGTELTDLAGEQRNDTEKTIRKYIGTGEDLALTSLSAQGEINQVIELGSSKRNQMLSKFLDLDIFYKLYQLASQDVSSAKTMLKHYPDKDWQSLAVEKGKSIRSCDSRISELTMKLSEHHERLSTLRAELNQHHDTPPVTKLQIQQQRERVANLTHQVDENRILLEKYDVDIERLTANLATIDDVRQEHDLEDLRKRQDALRKLETAVTSLRHNLSKESTTLKQQRRSLKILDDVPCGDQFPTCMFIKDAHENKEAIPSQEERVATASDLLTKAEISLEELKKDDVTTRIKQLEEMHVRHSKLTSEVSNLRVNHTKLESSQKTVQELLKTSQTRLHELEEAIKTEVNVEVVTLRNEIDSIQHAISQHDQEKLSLATRRGREVAEVETLAAERKQRQSAMQTMKIRELISVAFSKKGIPSIILGDRLPFINAEISKILSGIVDFTVELERDEETEQLEIFLNYGDSRRVIELGSGMEKAISSIALRVALINVSSLPKTDFFVIDEGFGVFDDAGVEACNRLLLTLKRYFRLIFVITHIDGIKDVADHILEITKNEKDSKVVFE